MRPLILLALVGLVACHTEAPAPDFDRYRLAAVSGPAVPITGEPEGFLVLRRDGSFRMFLKGIDGGTATTADILGRYEQTDGAITFAVEQYCAGVVGFPRPCDSAAPHSPIIGQHAGSEVTVTTGIAWTARFAR